MATTRAACVILATAIASACAAGSEPPLLPQTPAAISTVPGGTITVVPTPCRLPPTAGMVWLWHPTDPPVRVGQGIPLGAGRSCVVRPDSLPGETPPDHDPPS